MEVRYAKTAARHHISRERISYVVHNAVTVATIFPEGARTERTLHIGPDSQGVMLEVISVEGQRGDTFVIHAMQLRPRYRVLLHPIH